MYSIASPAADSLQSRALNPVGPKAFKGAMRHLAGAVSIVTVGRIGERTGLTAVSYQPS